MFHWGGQDDLGAGGAQLLELQNQVLQLGHAAAADLDQKDVYKRQLPLTPAGHYLVAARPAVTGKQGTRNVVLQPESWYAVQDTTCLSLIHI